VMLCRSLGPSALKSTNGVCACSNNIHVSSPASWFSSADRSSQGRRLRPPLVISGTWADERPTMTRQQAPAGTACRGGCRRILQGSGDARLHLADHRPATRSSDRTPPRCCRGWTIRVGAGESDKREDLGAVGTPVAMSGHESS
jgi:hypothetical protein